MPAAGADVERNRAVALRPRAEALRLLQRDVAVRDESTESRQTDLAAVRVTAEDRIGTEVDEAVQYALIRRVGCLLYTSPSPRD